MQSLRKLFLVTIILSSAYAHDDHHPGHHSHGPLLPITPVPSAPLPILPIPHDHHAPVLPPGDHHHLPHPVPVLVDNGHHHHGHHDQHDHHDHHHHHHHALPNIKHEHSHVASDPVYTVYKKPEPHAIIKVNAPVQFRKPIYQKPIIYQEKPLPYLPGYKWNNYTNQREK